jgi:hypothetical protein
LKYNKALDKWECADDASPTLPLSVAEGGTGATTSVDARTNLGTSFQDYILVNNFGAADQVVSPGSPVINYSNQVVYNSPGGSLGELNNNRVEIKKSGLYIINVAAYLTFDSGTTGTRQYSIYARSEKAAAVCEHLHYIVVTTTQLQNPNQVTCYAYLEIGDRVYGQVYTTASSKIAAVGKNNTSMFVARISP